ncbi:MAG: sigma-54 dependent transcriptional regulator [Lachnoclostridium sp.]|nr:sigma-54 dependent transcriptional regulator [Lachnoclostridium sp.]
MKFNNDIPDDVLAVKQRFGIVGNSPALTAALQRSIRVAPFDLSVLITGESGTGKEFFPKIIHAGSPRKHGKYIAVNCGAIPEGTIDSELFGHEKGAFTGAVSSRNGYFEEADGGTIFLDEVGELPLPTQARLLRVLETGEYIKVGSSTVRKCNVRIVAATNVDMSRAVAEGRFREDLFYRLSTVAINIPPLRDRGNDILLLSRKFVADFAEQYHVPSISFDDSARTRLLHYRWPGNVRQLKNVVEQLALFDSGNEINAEMLESFIPESAATYTPAPLGYGAASSSGKYDLERDALFSMIFRMQHEIETLKSEIAELSSHQAVETPLVTECAPETPHHDTSTQLVKFTPFVSQVLNTPEDTAETLEETERETIRRSLERNGGRRKATAQELNISERTLYRKIKEYGIE